MTAFSSRMSTSGLSSVELDRGRPILTRTGAGGEKRHTHTRTLSRQTPCQHCHDPLARVNGRNGMRMTTKSEKNHERKKLRLACLEP